MKSMVALGLSNLDVRLLVLFENTSCCDLLQTEDYLR